MRIQALTQQLGFLLGGAPGIERVDGTTRKNNGERVRRLQSGSGEVRELRPALRFSLREGAPISHDPISHDPISHGQRTQEAGAPVQ